MLQSTLRARFLASLTVGLLLITTAAAEIPQYVSYQGKITDTGGVPVADGSYTMRFRIYNDPAGGSLLWDSGNRSVTTSQGVASILLGESPQPALDLAFDADYWLLVTFAGVDQTPRVRITSAGYSYMASMASGVVPGTTVSGSISSGAYAAIKGVNTDTSGNTYGGSFESHSTAGCGVIGRAWTTAGTTSGVWGHNQSTNGHGVYGYAAATTGTTKGVEGQSLSPTGRGVVGYASASTGANYGIYGVTNSPSGYAGYFQGNARVTGNLTVDGTLSGSGIGDITSVNAGNGLAGGSTSGDATLSVGVPLALSGSHSNPIVQGTNSASSGFSPGVKGETSSTSGNGVEGIATASTGFTHGVYGRSNSTAGVGVLGTAYTTSSDACGVWGEATAGTGVCGVASSSAGLGCGVWGESHATAGTGVKGRALATDGTTYGVWGEIESQVGSGVYGVAKSTPGQSYGVRGESYSTDGAGVYGIGRASTGFCNGVYGTTFSPSGYAGYFDGNARVTGGLTVDGTLSCPGVGDITSVIAGVGLSGGADSGDAVLDIQVPLSLSGSSSGAIISGSSTATSGETYGGLFTSSSSDGFGVYGSVSPPSPADRIGVAGYCKPANYYGIGVMGEGGYYGVSGVCSNSGSTNSAYGVRGTASGASVSYGVYGSASGAATNWGVYASGNLGASGTKSAVVRTEEGPKAVYCMESTEVWFEDFGSGEIRNGQAAVSLASDFVQTVVISDEHPFRVFITPKARLGEWWVEDGTRDFRLVAPDALDGARFDYRVVAKRAGYEGVRLESMPDAYSDHFLYPNISEVPAAHQAEWLKSDAVRKERAPDRATER